MSSAEQLLGLLGLPAAASARRGGGDSGRGQGAAASPEQREILVSLAREPATRDELLRRLGRTPEQLSLQLMDLELADRVAVDRDGRLVVRSPRPGRGGAAAGFRHPGDGAGP